MNNLISIKICGDRLNVSEQFIIELHEYDLIELIEEKESRFIQEEHISALEKFCRLHRDLEVNTPGLAVVKDLLERLELQTSTIKLLKQKLSLYE